MRQYKSKEEFYDSCYLEFKYCFSTSNDIDSPSAFIQDIDVDIHCTDFDTDESEKVGYAKFVVVLIDQAVNEDAFMFDVFDDHSEYLARHIFDIVNSVTLELNTFLQDYYNDDFMGRNICLIEKVVVYPAYRGFGIGADVLKDIVFQYNSSCGMFALQPYPLQFEPHTGKVEERNFLELDKYTDNEDVAFAKLSEFYQNIGFDKVKGLKELMFLNPALRNERSRK